MPTDRTFPMLVGGRLRRAPVGRGVPVPGGVATTATVADVTDAVTAARAALAAWSGAGGSERGRVLHGIAELLDERRDRLGDDPPTVSRPSVGTATVAAAVDRWLWYAGWADKVADLLGAARAADGTASWSVPRPVGVVGAAAPPSLLGLVDTLAPILAAGATAVVLVPQDHARAVASLAEVLATADLPPGAANLLTGDVAALAPALVDAGMDGLDLGEPAPEGVAGAAARGVRVVPAGAADPVLARLRAWSRTTTVWHPAGR